MRPAPAARRLVPWLAFFLTLGLALPVLAQDDDFGDWDDDEEEEAGFSAYIGDVGNRASMGANSLLTFAADPFVGVAQPRDEFDELPASRVTKWPVGLVQGTLLSAYRLGMGTMDLLFSWMTPMKIRTTTVLPTWKSSN